MRHIWEVAKAIRDGFDTRYERETGETDSLSTAKAMAEEAYDRHGGGRTVRAKISRPEGSQSWSYEPGRRSQMVWRCD
ncbi:hypothetical protein [Microvirga massiliensis]|uniref:hypothetical protein n=1 Tax=Microvirga massiliensis TaxID=1033741 RepID=UPI00062BB92A|nr:hypothetical protein [Microvirga massiliensis]